MKSSECIEVENIDHLGLVAGIIDEIGLVEQINQILGQHPQEKVSAGHAVKAMILNGLGFVSGALYMFPKFFEGLATEHLIGKGVRAEYLNDDRLGRVMDQLYLKGLSQIFTLIALAAAKKFSVSLSSIHVDSSSFQLHGEHKSSLPEVTFINKQEVQVSTGEENLRATKSRQPINITYGYSRDHRPDLKQFIVDLICSGDGDIPIFLKASSGNESDSAVFAQILVKFRQEIDIDSLMVGDSALYSAENIVLMKKNKWLSRVPLTLGAAKILVSELKTTEFVKSKIEGYSYVVKTSKYAGVEQRWLIVESEARKKSDQKQLKNRIDKLETTAQTKLNKLVSEEFACRKDAMKAASQLSEQLKYYKLTEIKISKQQAKIDNKQKKKSEVKLKECYKIEAKLEKDKSVIETEMQSGGRFILATNILKEQELSNDQMISEYKAQQSCERGFGFLKDPLFFADSVFLKSPERIEALAMLMGLCLLVYTLAQRQLRAALLVSKSEIKNQLGKRTNRPTLRWIFQCFQSIHLLIVNGVKQISNLTDERLWILNFFPDTCRRYYLL